MKPEFDNRLVRRIFELRMLFLAGEYPNVFRCVSCGAKENLTTFHVRRGGMLCGGCGAVHGGIAVDASTLYTMQFVLSAPPEKLYSFQVSETVLSSLERILNDYMACYADRRFHSLELLDAL
jgi:DNA repair protein RecO (recombination protein O)